MQTGTPSFQLVLDFCSGRNDEIIEFMNRHYLEFGVYPRFRLNIPKDLLIP